MPGLNPANDRPGYLAGRIFATLERAEDAATGGRQHVLMDSKFAVCVGNPRVVLRLADTLGAQYLRKLATREPGQAGEIADTVADLTTRIGAGTWSRDLSEDQSLFTVGYHHQRHADDLAAGLHLTTAEVAELIGVGSAVAARVQLRRWGVDSSGTDDATGGKLWRRAVVLAAHNSRPGRGARTDLRQDS